MAIPDITPLTDAELDQLRIVVLTEQERRTLVAIAHQTAADLASRYEQAVTSTDPIPWADVPDAIGPGVAVIFTDGNRWRNKSGAWLPKTASPTTYPLGWTQETGLPTASPWSETGVYAVDALVTYGDEVYRCIQAHTANSTWAPTVAVSLWTLA